jgi:DNA replication protein DnaC
MGDNGAAQSAHDIMDDVLVHLGRNSEDDEGLSLDERARHHEFRLRVLEEYERNAWYECENCRDKGVVEGSYFKPETLVWCDQCWRGPQYRRQFEESQAEREVKARARRKAALARLFGETDVPRKFRGMTLETLKQRFGHELKGKINACVAARKLIEHGQVVPSDLPDKGNDYVDPDRPRKGLLLYGPVGVGKTGIAASVFNATIEALSADATALFVDVSDLIRRKQESYSGGEADQRNVAAAMAAIRQADLLVLDDLGDAARNGSTTTDKRAIMYDVIHTRYNDDGGVTIVTTNLEPGELYEQWGDRLADRLLDMLLPVQISGANLRKASSRVKTPIGEESDGSPR